MSYEFAKKEIGDYRITITRMRMLKALLLTGLWQEFTSGIIQTTDTTEDCLLIAVEKLAQRTQKMP